MRVAAFALLTAVGIIACRSVSGPPDGAEILTIDAGRDSAPRRYSGSSFTSRERIVIRDSAHMAQVWPKLTQGSMPSVDFRNEILVVASMGTRGTGGFS